MLKGKKIPTILALVLLTLSTAAGVFFVQRQQLFRISASEEYRPQNVKVSNISDTSLTITWSTQKETEGFVMWGDTAEQLENTAQDELTSPSYLHSTSLLDLEPNKTYFFSINSQGNNYDNNGSPWTSKTGAELETPEEPDIISGTLLKSTGTPSSNSIIILNVNGASPLSTTTSDNGSFVIAISELRNTDSSDYFSFTDETVFEITGLGGAQGTSTAQSKYSGAKNLPPMILEQVHDFRNLPPNEDDEDLEANLNSPDLGDEENSGFDLGDEDLATASATTITIDSIEDGEVVTTLNPEFFGEGPTGTEVTITVRSENPVSETITVGSGGKWSWSPPQNLSVGEHTITLSWKDAEGAINTITRNFVVSAAELDPAFVATPSATKTATPSATLPPTPVSGVETPTLVLIAIAFGLIIFAATGIYLAYN